MGSDLDWIMIGNGDVVQATFSGDQTNVTASLAARFVTDAAQRFG
jgi:hypothetical protein